MAVAFGPASYSSGLLPKSFLSSCTVQKYRTVLFQNTALMVAKTSPFGLKNRRQEYKKTRKRDDVDFENLKKSVVETTALSVDLKSET